MIVIFTAASRHEADLAADHYQAMGGGLDPDNLGSRFQADLEGAVARIVQFPHAHPPLRGGFRRSLLTRFPYHIIYRVEDDAIRIYAVAHLKRRPGYWRRRMPG
ncbi:MAG: type II toxin-antitoxin system RelE/ParE family toxin [Hyphomicrobiaceae bacterium]|nr:type II toxin-antitoxin system RelE/ParE family toxin [Hyphomicrobiaceae bacterium]